MISRTDIIQSLIDIHQYDVYLEIGIERGLNFNKIKASVKLAVDPYIQMPYINTNNVKFFETTSDDFFNRRPPELINGVDIVFIDGLHTYDQSLRDVENSLKYLKPNGIIVMHDCLPDSEATAAPSWEEAARHPEFSGNWTGDVYKTIVYLRSFRKDLFVATIDTDWGIGIVTKDRPENMLNMSLNDINELTFDKLIADKENLLNLKTTSWFFGGFNVCK
jgi:hypothetical protein